MLLFFVTQYNSSLSSCVPNFRILTKVVAEKSLTEKILRTNIITERAKTINPLYTSYGGGGGGGGGGGVICWHGSYMLAFYHL